MASSDLTVWLGVGLIADRPASDMVVGAVYFATDTGVLSRWSGSAWADKITFATGTAITDHTGDTTDAHDASAISIADAGSYFTGTQVEAALQEIGALLVLNNVGASTAPTVNDDSGDGYSIGSRWLDTTNDKEYVALDVSVGAAVWEETTSTGGGGGAAEDITFDATGLTQTAATDVQAAIEDLDGAIDVLSAGGGAMTLIADQLLGSDTANFDFTSISGSYKHLRLFITGRSDRSATSDGINLRFNNDSGSNYDREQMQAIGTSGTYGTNFANGEDLGATSITQIAVFSAASSVAGAVGSTTIDIINYAGTTFHKTMRSVGGGKLDTGSGNTRTWDTWGLWRSTSAITRITIYPNAGSNFKTGSRATLYGIS